MTDEEERDTESSLRNLRQLMGDQNFDDTAEVSEVKNAFRKIRAAVLNLFKQIMLVSIELLIKVSIVVWLLRWMEVID